MNDSERNSSALNGSEAPGSAGRGAVSPSPVRLVTVLALSIFAAEAALMILFSVLSPFPSWALTVLDAGSLVVLLFPVIYFFVFRPLVEQVDAQRKASEALRAARDRLELRVSERTAELKEANSALLPEVAKRKQVEEGLREREAGFRDLYDHAPVGYIEMDTEGRITRVNDSQLSMLGYTADQMLNQHAWEFVKEKDAVRDEIAAGFRNADPPASQEHTYVASDGREIPVSVEHRVLRDVSGTIKGLRSTAQDITARKKAEQEIRNAMVREERQTASRKMLLVLMHDVYNPLTGILGNLSLLGMEEVTPGIRECLKEIHQCAQRINSALKELATQDLADPTPITGGEGEC